MVLTNPTQLVAQAFEKKSYQTECSGVTHCAQRSGCSTRVFVDMKPH